MRIKSYVVAAVLVFTFTLNPRLRNVNRDFSLGSCLAGSAKLTKNANLDDWYF